MKRRYFYVFPVLVMLLVFGSPVFAAEIEEEPFPLKVFLEYDTNAGDYPFLMAEIPADLFQLTKEEEKIIAEEILVWTDTENGADKTLIYNSDWLDKGQKLSRKCLMSNDPMLAQYSNGEINTIHISMKLSKCIFNSDTDEKTVIETKTVYGCWQRPSANQDTVYDNPNSEANGTKMVFDKYPQKVYYVAGRVKSVQMQMTGTRGEPVELPSKIPVILGFCVNNSDNRVWLEEHAYPVSWKASPSVSDNEKMVYQVEKIDKPSDETDRLQFYYKDRWYQMDVTNQSFPEISSMDFPYSWMKCIINFVDPDYIPSILLLPDGGASSESVAVEIDYKPTNASKIEVEASTDGGTSWRHESDVDFEKYPIDAIPKLQGYSANILNHEQTVRLSQEGNGGFQVRLKIYGGPLGNAVKEGEDSYTITEAANWPLDYEYVPPENPSGNHGSGGNKGNVGTDNSGSSEGIRPGVEQQPEQTSEPKPTSESEAEIVLETIQKNQLQIPPETDTMVMTTTEPELNPKDISESLELPEDSWPEQFSEGQREKNIYAQKTIAKAAMAISGIFAVSILTSVIVKKGIAVQIIKYLTRLFHR